MSPESVMAELFGKAGGCSRGKGGSMHMFDKEVNFLGGHAIVGGQIPLATGVAFATKYKGTDQVTLSFFGEARSQSGRVPRVAEYGPALEIALHLHLRKQSVWDGHIAGARDV